MTQFSLKLNLILLVIFAVAELSACAEGTKQPDNQSSSISNYSLTAPTGPVTDYAKVLDAETKQRLESKIIQFRNSTNPKVELAVAVVRTTGDRNVFDYSLAVARDWRIGSKENDNPGALLFIAVDDHSYYTQVSRDLEDELPDGITGSLQRRYLVPAFRQQQYGKGISDTLDAYIRVIKAKQSGQPAVAEQSD